MLRKRISWMHLLVLGSCLVGAFGGMGRSSCNQISCPKTKNYICGSDGKTYRNECQLQKRACKGPHVDQAYEGRCATARKPKRELVIGGYEWGLAAKNVPRGSPSAVILNVTAMLDENGGKVTGVNLWRLGVFGSQWNDGWGERKNEVVQLLDTAQQNQQARGGTPLTFTNVEGEFDYTDLGCDNEFGYLCFELAKGSEARPDFQLQILTFQESLIVCNQVTCQRSSCIQPCPSDDTPVCGSDGRTYPNVCEIENEIRCFPDTSLEVVFEDACDAGVTVTSIVWSVESTNYVRRGPSQFQLDAVVLTNGTLDVSGTELWRLGIFGSQNIEGSGPRFDHQFQLLNSSQAATPLIAALPINLHFEVPVEFDVGKLGCSAYKYLCLEFAKGDNASSEFAFRSSSSGKGVFICCKNIPCDGPEEDGTGRLRASFNAFNWGLRASGSGRRGEPVDVQLTVSVSPSPDGNVITGDNLWRIGLFGSGQANGMGNERFSYVRQTITDDQVSTPLIYPTNMEFIINTQFPITSVGCGDYPFLCVELAKADYPVPDFIFNDGGDAIVICQQVACQDNDRSSTATNRNDPSVAHLANLNWNLEIPHLVFGGPSNITLQVTVLPLDSTDSIEGEGLWRLGIYYSTRSDGGGDRHAYKRQILPSSYTDLPLASRLPLVFLDVSTLIDVTGLGCNSWRFVCIEFAKGDNPRPDFTLPLPGGADFAVTCRSFPCTSGGGENTGENVGAPAEPEYVPPGSITPRGDPNTQGDGTGEDTPSVSISSIRISNFRSMLNRVQFLLAVTPGRLSQLIEGEGLWRIGVYASSDRNGEQVGTPHTRQVLNRRSHSKSLRPPSQLVFDIDTEFQMQHIGCGNMRYLCIEFAKGDSPVPDFNLVLPGSDSVVTCQLMPCDAPPIIPYTPNNNNNNNEPVPNQPDLPQTGLGPRHFAYLTGLSWTMQPIIIRNDARSLIRLRISAPISNTSDTINGRGLWRVALFGSVDSLGVEPRFDYHHQILRQEDQNEVAMPYNNLSFNAIIDFDLMGLGCSQYKFLCIEFSKGERPVPDFYLPLSGGASSITSCQRARCLNPNVDNPATPASQQQQIARLARFSWEMNPLLKNPDGPSDVSFSLTLTPQPSSDVITGSGLWRVGVFGSKTENGAEPRTSYRRQVLNQLHTSQPLQGATTFDILTTLDMTEMGCGPYKFFCVEFAKGDNPQPDFNIPLNGGDSLVNCQHIPCRNTNRQRPYSKTRPPPPPPPPKPNTNANHVTKPEVQPTPRRPATPTPVTQRPPRITTSRPYHPMWPTMSRPGVTNRPVPQRPNQQQPRPGPNKPRPDTTRPEQEDQPPSTMHPVNSNTYELDRNFNRPNSKPQPEQPYSQPQPQPNTRIEIQPSIQDSYPDLEQRQRYVPIPGRKVVWFAAIRWKASIEKVFQDGSQEINLDVMLIPHNNRVNAVMGNGMWRMGIFGAINSQGSGPRHDYQNQILSRFDQSNPLLPPNFLQFDVDTEFDIKSVGCGQYKYVCLEFDKADTSTIEFDLVVEDGVLGPIISCQAAPCASSEAFLTTSGPPTNTRPQVIIRNVLPEEVSITEGAQNQLDVDVEIVYDQLSDDVTGNNMWRLELWTSPKEDGSGTRLVNLDQSLTDEQSSKDLLKPYPLSFTNIRVNLDMRGNRCSYVRYICARLHNSRSTRESPFDLTTESSYQGLTGCTRTQCYRSHGDTVSHSSSRPLVKFTGISVGIPTIEENILNKLALRVTLHVPVDSDAVSGSQLWTLAAWGSKKANGGGKRYSPNNQALTPQQAGTSIIPPSDVLFEYVRFDLDMSRVSCRDISYICVALSTQSTNFDLRGVPNDLALTGCTTITCETATVPELVVNSVALILPPTPIVAGQSNPMTMDFEVVYDVGHSAAVNGNNNWRVKLWGSDRANGGGPRLSQSTQALTRQQASQPLILGRPFTIRNIDYVMNLRGVYCRDVGFVCAQLVAGNNSFKLRPIPNKKSLTTCQRLHCING